MTLPVWLTHYQRQPYWLVYFAVSMAHPAVVLIDPGLYLASLPWLVYAQSRTYVWARRKNTDREARQALDQLAQEHP